MDAMHHGPLHTAFADHTQQYCPMKSQCLRNKQGLHQVHIFSHPLTQD